MPGIEVTTGPLGQGISDVGRDGARRAHACGALQPPGHDIVDHHTFVIASDGDMRRGSPARRQSLAGHLALGRLIVVLRPQPHLARGPTLAVVHRGRRQALRGVRLARPEPRARTSALDRPASRRPRPRSAIEDRPSLIIVRTHIGYGSPHKQDTAARPRLAARRGGGPADARRRTAGPRQARSTSPTRRSRTSAAAASAARELEAEWNERFDAYRRQFPSWRRSSSCSMPASCPTAGTRDVPSFDRLDGRSDRDPQVVRRR